MLELPLVEVNSDGVVVVLPVGDELPVVVDEPGYSFG